MTALYPIDFKWKAPPYPYAPSTGYFGWLSAHKNLELQDKVVNEMAWETCREMFTWHYIRPDIKLERYEFVFYHSALGKGLNLANFINEVENRLQLDLENRTQIHGFEAFDKASMVFPSKWWFNNQLRIQLFSILMRCGQHYEGDFDASLNQNSYAACTKQAIYKFLEGFTNWGGEYSDSGSCGLVVENQMDWKHGWAHWFSGGSHLELLIK